MGGPGTARTYGVLAALAVTLVACGTAQEARSSVAVKMRATPMKHDEVALYNNTASAVRVVGCSGCGASGEPLRPGGWLSLNLPPDRSWLQIVQPSRTTCLVVMRGIDTGKPLAVKVTDSAAGAC